MSDIEFISKEIILLKDGEIIARDNCNNLLKHMENKVFEIKIQNEDLKKIQTRYRISNLSSEEK